MPLNTTYYKLGRISFTISGDGPIVEEIRNELAPLQVDALVQIDIEYRFVDILPNVYLKQTGWVFHGKNCLRVEYGKFRYEIKVREGSLTIEIEKTPSTNRNYIIKWLWRFANYNYLRPEEAMAKNFMYNIFDWTIQVSQLALGQSYIHASAISSGSRGIAFLAWGGVGKTSAVLKLCLENEWKYLSDDLAVVDTEGTLYLSPKKFQVYGYNIVGESRLRKILLKDRSLMDLLNWYTHFYLRGPMRVRRRVSPRSLFGVHGVASRSHLTSVIFMERSNADHCTLHPLHVAESARRMAPTVMAEIEPFASLYRQSSAAGIGFPFEPSAIESRTREVLELALSHGSSHLLEIGRNTRPLELAAFIRERILDNDSKSNTIALAL